MKQDNTAHKKELPNKSAVQVLKCFSYFIKEKLDGLEFDQRITHTHKQIYTCIHKILPLQYALMHI